MRTLGIAYAMYFNIRNERSGNLFVRPFRSKHVADDRYFKYVVQYIHLNPAELFAPSWKNGVVTNVKKLLKDLRAYPYSSLLDYTGKKRPERAILESETVELLSGTLPSLQNIVEDAAEYLHLLSR